MIRIEIVTLDHPNFRFFNEDAYKYYVTIQLKDAGVPTINGPVDIEIDYSKGKLTKFYNPLTRKDVFVWDELS